MCHQAAKSSGVGVTKPIFSIPLFPQVSQNYQNTGYQYNMMFIFDTCHRSWAAVTPDKYEHDLEYIIHTFAESKFPVMEKSTKGALVTPTPEYIGQLMEDKI